MLIPRRVSRSVAARLAAGVLPSLLAVGLVVGLIYYGELGREAPHTVVMLAAALTLLSIAVSWANASYFAERLARLARVTEQASGIRGPTDEFDRIEQAVGTLGSALTAAEAERSRLYEASTTRLREQATMLAGAVSDSLSQLDQVRLPLQILLESPFGELNDNQEELLRDARTAADGIDMALRRLGQVADIDRDAVQTQLEAVQVNDIVRSVLPLARAAAERQGGRAETTLEPGLPRVVADRTRLAEALALFVTDAATAVGSERPLSIATSRDGGAALIRITPAAPDRGAVRSSNLVLATRLLEAQGGTVASRDGILELRVGQQAGSFMRS